ncbi:coiled-coil domain-containing protein 82 isoform X2 [Varanus komodoensis]|uniref:coiled-coil domain-containing protein 82 isoform X2 n=1 Tax=Varanus komodoensis TaxID=61221 RepID=UPI001CF792CD|nr:coiled-coil domain-containing protein 82 isoform X2 [Varanus komodoensis]
METNSISRRYETRRSTRAETPVAKSRVDWQRTKRRSRLLDSEEEDDELTSPSEKEFETSSDDDADEKGKDESILHKNEEEPAVNAGGLSDDKTGCDGATAEDVEEEHINPGKRKRSRLSVMYDSDESDDSDIVRKVFAKRSCIIDEEDLSVNQKVHTTPAEEAANRKEKRLMKLKELSRRRSASACINEHVKDTDDEIILDDSNDTSEANSMKDFIVDEEEGEELDQENSEKNESQPQGKEQALSCTLLEKHIPCLSRVDHFVHFQRVVKAFLINAVDDTFLSSLYEGKRQKKYAQNMLTSLHYLDDRFVQPRLDNLLSRSRWKERYKERVDSYPDVRIVLGKPVQRSCQACELQRYCKFTVHLSGKLYNSETLEVDDFMSHDKQLLKVGVVCGNRTRVYHNLRHFKYKLYQDCCLVMKNDGSEDGSVKDSVERVFSQLDEDGWIDKVQ